MLKVLTVVGTRPEIIRLSETIKILDDCCDHRLVHTGQNYDYELNQIFFDDLGIRKPDNFLNAAAPSLAKTIANIFLTIDEIFEQFLPDAFLVLGDTNSSLAAILAKRRKIPVFHVEAGNRCFDYNVPEEINRKIVDNVSDINITYSQLARSNLINEGFDAQRVICLGSPMKEVIHNNISKVENSKILLEMGLESNSYFVFSLHREENVEFSNNLEKAVQLIKFLCSEYGLPVVLSLHPRTKKRLAAFDLDQITNLIIHSPFSFTDYLFLQLNSKIVFSDSGTITEEASILGFDAINLRETHERPEGIEVGSVMFTGLKIDNVQNAVRCLLRENNSLVERSIVSDYDVDDFSVRLLKCVLSYTDYVNKYVWAK